MLQISKVVDNIRLLPPNKIAMHVLAVKPLPRLNPVPISVKKIYIERLLEWVKNVPEYSNAGLHRFQTSG